MKILIKYIIINFLLHFQQFASGQNVTLYYLSDLKGKFFSVNVSECATFPSMFNSNTESINTYGNCVQLYDNKDCRGKFTIIGPNSGHNLRNFSFANTAESSGPCFGKCANQKESFKETALVSFYGENMQTKDERPKEILKLKERECKDISDISNYWSYSAFRVKLKSKTCIEIHEFEDCSGTLAQLYGSNITTGDYWLDRHKSKSISFCGYNCEDLEANSTKIASYFETYNLNETFKKLTEGKYIIVTNNDYLYGPYPVVSLEISDKCIKLPSSWKTDSNKTIYTGGNCFSAYSDLDCELFLENINFETTSYKWNIKAVKECYRHSVFWFIGCGVLSFFILLLFTYIYNKENVVIRALPKSR